MVPGDFPRSWMVARRCAEVADVLRDIAHGPAWCEDFGQMSHMLPERCAVVPHCLSTLKRHLRWAQGYCPFSWIVPEPRDYNLADPPGLLLF